MRMRIKNRAALETKKKELLDFARSYLSEAFPNADRQGCPPDAALRTLAFSPNESEPTVTEHLAVCSPCFNRYTELLAEFKSQQRAEERSSWTRIFVWSRAHPLLVGAALVFALFIAIGASLLFNRIRVPNPPPLDTHRAPNPIQPVNPEVAYSPFSLDLSALSPVRGSESAAGTQRRVPVPSSPLDLNLTLPLASAEGRSDLRLTAGSETVWSKSAQAHLLRGKTLIQVEADFRPIRTGNYNLEVQSSNGIRLVQPVLIQAASPKSEEQKP